MTVGDVVQATGGRCLTSARPVFRGVGTDSRQDLTGLLFVALLGDQFDAHNFVEAAIKKGAVGVLVHRRPENFSRWEKDVAVIEVGNTLKALQSLAQFWRRRNRFTVAAITGSNGKTTTKEFARTIIGSVKPVYASQGSFNNHWGVPLSLLAAGPQQKIVIQEMGMNHKGEISALAAIAEPEVVVVTMVGRAHIGELGSQAAVAAAKEELYLSCPKAIQIFNLDNEWTTAMLGRAKKAKTAKRILTFSAFRDSAEVYLRAERVRDFRLEISGHIGGRQGRAVVPVFGRQNLVNLMAASSLAIAVGIEPEQIWAALPQCRGLWGRGQVVRLPNGAHVLFDGYNANPESMAALLRNLYEIEGVEKKIAVLGEMKELGSMSPAAHRELGALVARTGVEVVWFMGGYSDDFVAGLKAEGFSKKSYISSGYEESLAHELGAMISPADIVVIKGSRAMKMEQVLAQWRPLDFTATSSSSRS